MVIIAAYYLISLICITNLYFMYIFIIYVGQQQLMDNILQIKYNFCQAFKKAIEIEGNNIRPSFHFTLSNFNH